MSVPSGWMLFIYMQLKHKLKLKHILKQHSLPLVWTLPIDRWC